MLYRFSDESTVVGRKHVGLACCKKCAKSCLSPYRQLLSVNSVPANWSATHSASRAAFFVSCWVRPPGALDQQCRHRNAGGPARPWTAPSDVARLFLGNGGSRMAKASRRILRSKHRVFATGRTQGGTPFSRGQLHAMLTTPTYRGLMRHKEKSGQACIPPSLTKGLGMTCRPSCNLLVPDPAEFPRPTCAILQHRFVASSATRRANV